VSLTRRVKRLEDRLGISGPEMSILRINLMDVGPDGPIDLGPHIAYILRGPNAGTEIHREDGETAEAFDARCDDLIGGVT